MARRPHARPVLPLAVLAVVALLVATAATLGGPRLASASSPARARRSPRSPIRHVIEVMLENHTFDDLFDGFPGADGIPAGTTLPGPGDPSRRVAPLLAPENEGDVQGGLNNSRAAELEMMDPRPGGGYRMDGYTRYPGEGLSSITVFSPSTDPDLQYLARSYELADHNFQPAIAPTLPNVLYGLAATSEGHLTNSVPATGSWRTIFDELEAAHRSWRIYAGVPLSVFRGTVWDRLVPPGSTGGLATTSRFLADLADGELPDFSFVRPGVGYSEEPPEDLGEGDAWLGQLVEAVARSRYWSSTALFVTYDEGGGFYDHLSPPAVPGSYGYGTRTPLLIVSPWVRGHLYHQVTTNLSVLAFVQHLFGLPALDRLNAEQDDLARAFDFARRPLAPPRPPVAPPATIGFYGPSVLADVAAGAPGRPLAVELRENSPGLALEPGVSGPVTLALVPPAGVPVPPGFPTSARLVDGRADLRLTFESPGYYRLEATGPGGALGWVTLDVGVSADTP